MCLVNRNLSGAHFTISIADQKSTGRIDHELDDAEDTVGPGYAETAYHSIRGQRVYESACSHASNADARGERPALAKPLRDDADCSDVLETDAPA